MWPFLDELAVPERADRQIVRIDVVRVDERRPERAEPVLSLDPQHRAAVGVAKVVDAPVVGDGVAADVAKGVAHGGAEAALADDDGDLALVVEEAAAARGARPGRGAPRGSSAA